MLNMKSKIFKYIYAMLCLLPAIAVGVTCLYVANNDNAYQSYSGELETEIVYPNSPNDLIEGNTYHFKTGALTEVGDVGGYTEYIQYSIVNVITNNSNVDVTQFDAIGFYSSGTQVYYYFNVVGETFNTDNTFSFASDVEFTFTYVSNTLLANNNILTYSHNIYSIELLQNGYIDNVFYYSLDKVENSNVFSWVKTNFLYSGVNQFVGIFGGTNSNISFYLTWVLTISLCYLGFEVLMLFINMARNLIHSFTDKDRW